MKREIEKIALHYGKLNQTLQTIEELSELIRALARTYTTGDTVNMIEEIADVEVMLAQIKILFEIDVKAITTVKEHKIKRQIERIGGQNDL